MDATFLFIFVAVFGFVALAGLGLAFAGGGSGGGGGARATKRVAAVAAGTKADRQARPSRADAATTRRKQILQNLKTADKQERRAKLTLDSRIQQAGLSISVRHFWMVCAVLAVVGAGVGLVAAHNPMIALGAGFVVGFGLPRWFLAARCKGRHKKFTAELPNAIDIVVRGIKSGLPVNDCLRVIAMEGAQPLGDEFRRLTENLSGGLTMDQAMERMYARMPTAEMRFFAIVLNIQQKTGGNLAEALGNLSSVLRARKLMVEKVKALSGEAVASAFIIGSLPPAVMALITVASPGYMTPLFVTSGGHLALGIGVAMMAMGIFVMRRMINFKI